MSKPMHMIAGKLATPNEAQESRAQKNGGWRTVSLGPKDTPIYWNACVSPGFADTPYQAYGRTISKQEMYSYIIKNDKVS
jgi:hypothetical protein